VSSRSRQNDNEHPFSTDSDFVAERQLVHDQPSLLAAPILSRPMCRLTPGDADTLESLLNSFNDPVDDEFDPRVESINLLRYGGDGVVGWPALFDTCGDMSLMKRSFLNNSNIPWTPHDCHPPEMQTAMELLAYDDHRINIIGTAVCRWYFENLPGLPILMSAYVVEGGKNDPDILIGAPVLGALRNAITVARGPRPIRTLTERVTGSRSALDSVRRLSKRLGL
jgi:hypothetical protein